jgi:SsrA-binding protein
MASAKNKDASKNSDPVIARNRKAFHDYEILETCEAGIVLVGTEVKSCRSHSVQLQDCFARIERGELLAYGIHISLYAFGNRFNHETKRPRKLLMHKKEILRLANKVKEKGYALIPLKMYLKGMRVKVELGIARGKTFGDKRETLRRKQDDLDMRRAVASARKRG